MTKKKQLQSKSQRARQCKAPSPDAAPYRLAIEIGRLIGKLLADDEQRKNLPSSQSDIPKSAQMH